MRRRLRNPYANGSNWDSGGNGSNNRRQTKSAAKSRRGNRKPKNDDYELPF